MSEHDVKIKVIAAGPLRVSGADLCRVGIEHNEHQRPVAYNERGGEDHAEAYSLCRCGASANKPFCDGAHRDLDWDPSETADLAPTASRQTEHAGNGFVMTDDKSLCWHAGFCVREYGHVWDLIDTANSAEETATIKEMIHACPSSRLQVHETSGGPSVEPELPQRIAILDDGPLYVQGRIPVEGSDGRIYEQLHRVSLCRCGASQNKPYCDGTHTKTGFRDPE